MHWGRVRKSLKSKRNEEDFQKSKEEIKILEGQDADNIIDLVYFDEAGISLVPYIPYAWQDPDDPILQPSSRSARINVLGFLDKSNNFTPYTFVSSVNSDVVIACFDDFAKSLKRTTIVVIDNAPVHRSIAFEEKIEFWESQGLYLYNIPKYSPELNKIEILWKMIKYYWLKFEAYTDFKSLERNLDEVLINIGTKYVINFV